MFTTEFLLKNLKIAVEPEILYHYRIRHTSIMNQTLTDKHVDDLLQVSYDQAQVLLQQGYLDYVGRYYYLQILHLKYRIYQNGRNRKYLRKVKKASKRVPLKRNKLKPKERIVIDTFQYAMPVYCVYRSWRERKNMRIAAKG